MKKILILGGSIGSIGGDFIESYVLNYDYEIHNVFKYGDIGNGDFVYNAELSTVDGIKDMCDQISGIEFDYFIFFCGVSYVSWFENIDIDKFNESMSVNLNSFVFVTQELLKTSPKCTIISVCSSAANIPMRCSLPYNTSKAALQMAIRQMAREITPKTGAIILGINPSIVDSTNMTAQNKKAISKERGWSEDAYDEGCRSMSPDGNLISKNQVSEAIFNMMQTATPNISGSIIQLGVF